MGSQPPKRCSPSAANETCRLEPHDEHDHDEDETEDDTKPDKPNTDDGNSDSSDDTAQFTTFRALRLTLQFHPQAVEARQTVNLTFDESFVPSPTAPLVLCVGHGSTVCRSHDTLFANPDAEPGDVCVIENTVNLFCFARPLPWWRRWLVSSLANLRPPYLVLVPLLLVLLAITVDIIAFPALRYPLAFLSPATEPEAACVCASKQPSASALPPVPLVHVRHAPIPLFDDLSRLLVQHTNLPLPVTVSAQAVVEQHYQANPWNPQRRRRRPATDAETPGAQTSVAVFLADVQLATDELCDTLQAWIAYSGAPAPGEDDVSLLCRSMRRGIVNVAQLWASVTATLTFPWASTSTTAVLFLLQTLRQHDEDRAAAAAPADDGHDGHDAHNNHDPNGDPSSPAFNRTSYSLLRRVQALFFTDMTRPGRLSSFATVVYQVSQKMDALEQAMADHISSLGMLVNLLQEHDVVKAVRDHKERQRRQQRQGIAGGWFAGPAATHTELALDRVDGSYNDTLALLNTQSTLVWIVGFTRRQLGDLRAELERQGNYTSALLATTPPRERGDDDGDDYGDGNARVAAGDDWWRGLPWVTEERGADGGRDMALERTYWYVPAVRGIIMGMAGLANWKSHETSRSMGQWEWTRTAEAAWQPE